ncbi:unnamed protein product [Adineta steineri]|uniref:Uncharacterized protein n=1 Tax=Adineta steineri TaxID=433720 RepID=A0A818M5T1_9BILA|nr:unnamed protein product [Adineta steineri]CAF0925085.1 unnamed protein product [Adineta steineri]CAF3584888.1 unnamed protein product [Adineta steineri]CAF3851847.1 unnamed protein product [Adineta steineri]
MIQIPPTSIITNYSIPTTLLTKDMCYLPDGSKYKRNYLRQLVTERESTGSPYINNTRGAVMSRPLIENTRILETIFRNPPFKDMIKPSCDGLWMEFGVYRGSSLKHIADWKRMFCGNNSQPVYGFDTFTGLPTDWRGGFGRGAFNIPNGTNISVPYNVVLVKGLFIDTLSDQLLLFDHQYQCHTPVSFVHIDCDIYDGTRDILFLLGSRFVSGTILLFDELFNYPGYEKHELKALYEFLSSSNVRLIPVGTSVFIDRHPMQDGTIQSFAFVVDLEQNM